MPTFQNDKAGYVSVSAIQRKKYILFTKPEPTFILAQSKTGMSAFVMSVKAAIWEILLQHIRSYSSDDRIQGHSNW